MNSDAQKLIRAILVSGLILLILLPIGILLGPNGFFYKSVFVVHLLVQIFAVYIGVRLFIRAIRSEKFSYCYLILFLVFFIACLIQTVLPITSKDALIHHLAIPKLWIEHGHIYELAWHEWSHYPMLVQLGYMGLMSLGLVQLSALYHFSYLLLLCSVIFVFVGARISTPRYQVWAFLVTLSTPLFLRLSGEPLVDLPLALYMALAITLLTELIEDKFSGSIIIKAGIALGLALGVKYNAIPAVFFLLITFIVYGTRKGVTLGSQLRVAGIVSAIALFLFSPWLIKNYLWIGNALYPFLPSVVENGQKITKVIAKFSPLEQRHLLYGEDPIDLLLIPFRMIFSGADNSPVGFDGVLSPILVLMFGAIVLWRKNPWALWQGLFCLSYACFSLLTASARTRYLIPLALPAIALTTLQLSKIYINKNLAGRYLVGAILVFHFCFAGIYAVELVLKLRVSQYLRGELSEDAYLQTFIKEYGLIKFINEHTSTRPDAKIWLLATGNRFFYYTASAEGGSQIQRSFVSILQSAASSEDITNALKTRSVTHLVLNRNRMEAVLGPVLTQEQISTFNKFIASSLKQIHSEAGYSIYELNA